MGFLDRIFGRGEKSASSPGGGSVSVSRALLQQKGTVTPLRCDECGATYMSSEQEVLVVSMGAPSMTLDIGGYCQSCAKTRCQKHVKFAPVRSSRFADKPELQSASWGVVCIRCGTQVRHDRHRDPDRVLVLIAMDSLIETKPAPKAEFTGSSGRLSLERVISQQMGPLSQRTCSICSSRYPHPPQVLQLNITTMEVRPEQFEIDVGGRCPSCGDICSRHVEMRETRVQGQRALRLFCKKHNSLLT